MALHRPWVHEKVYQLPKCTPYPVLHVCSAAVFQKSHLGSLNLSLIAKWLVD